MTESIAIAHRLVGIAVVLFFLATGALMRSHEPSLLDMDDAQRLLYRSGHIYILFAGLLNLMVGAWLHGDPRGAARALVVAGSALLLLAPELLAVGFFIETPLGELERRITQFGIFAAAAGTVCHGIAGYLIRRR